MVPSIGLIHVLLLCPLGTPLPARRRSNRTVAWLLWKPKCQPPLHLLRSAFPKGSPASNNGAGLLSEGLVQTSFLPPFQRGTLPIGKPPEPKYPPPPHLLGRMFRADSPVLLNSPRCDGERSGMDASATGLGVPRDDAVKAGCGKDGGGGKRVAEALEDCGVGLDCDDRSDGSGGDGELVATKFRFSCGPQDAGDGLSLRGSARMPVVLKRRKLWRPHDDEWSGPTPPVVNDGRFGRDKAARTIQCDICKGFSKATVLAPSPVRPWTNRQVRRLLRWIDKRPGSVGDGMRCGFVMLAVRSQITWESVWQKRPPTRTCI